MQGTYHVILDKIPNRFLDDWQNIIQIIGIIVTLILGFIAALPAIRSLPRLRARIQHSMFFKFPDPKLIVTNMSSNETVLFCIDTRCKGKRIIHKEVKQKLSEGQSAEFSLNWSIENEVIYKSIRVINAIGKSWKVPRRDIRRVNIDLKRLYKEGKKINDEVKYIGTQKLGNGGFLLPMIKNLLSYRETRGHHK